MYKVSKKNRNDLYIKYKNIDISILNGKPQELTLNGKYAKDSLHKKNEKYRTLGELKGGIDPAGADEHWKTANTALNRIRNSFSKINMTPKTFFVGAAIETSMSIEIYKQLEEKALYDAANLNNENQLIALCEWLIND